MIIIRSRKEILSFRVYGLGVFVFVVLTLGQSDLAVIDYVWVLCVDTFEYYAESTAE